MLKITKQSDIRVDTEQSGELALQTVGAVGVEASRLPNLFDLLGKFDRCAVLANESWIRAAGEIEGALVPGVEIRRFELGQVAAAEAWLAEGAG